MLLNGIWQEITEAVINNLILENRYQLILDGLKTTLIITVFAAVAGTVFGGLICWMRMGRNKIAGGFAKAYIDIMRGTPATHIAKTLAVMP